MAVLPIVKFPDKILKTRAAEVAEITVEDRRLVKNMIETMYAENGVGLAANQVGVLKRIFIAHPDQIKGNERVYFNPKILKKQGTTKEFEGCLSVPEFYEPVKRFKKVWMRAMTLDGKTIEVKGEGLLSRIFQHEIDHLDGILFIDRLGLLKSKLTRRKLLKKMR
ncbi:MAG: peptide deformylase [Candidatus Omnitrophica bacterium CG1_02_49_16]|nr:MAG: peptide deformylase [Candidatus Omnitrophica bacterium CG1_02_49_16]